MTEITRVPLQPIAKGSLAKLWIGIALVILLAAGVAWAAVPQGVSVTQLEAGNGGTPATGDVVFVDYVGKLADGTEFDRSQPSPFPPGMLPAGTPMLLEDGQLIPGFLQGLQQMQKGGKYRIEIPAALAYGETPPPGAPIPPNSDLVFEVTLNDFMSRAEVEARIQALQQQMMMQGQMPGAPSAAPAPPAGQ
jgi:FKBP-type peptidyl-prolyl cis-trans isomerase FkpA